MLSIILLFFTFSESEFIKDYFENTEYRNVSNVIVAMSRLETGHYKSKETTISVTKISNILNANQNLYTV